MTGDTTQLNLKEWAQKKKLQHDEVMTTKTGIYLKDEAPFYRRRAFLKLFMLFVIILCIFLDLYMIFHKTAYTCKDVLSPLPDDHDMYQRTCDYLRYLTQRVRRNGADGLYGKWVDDIPPFFKKGATGKLEILGKSGFVVDETFRDKNNIFHLRCHSLGQSRTEVDVDIMKEKVGKSYIFRLLRVY